MGNFRTKVRNFLFPPRGSSRWLLILPYFVFASLFLVLLVGGSYAWEYTNSPAFCGTSCHTMPPEYAAYQVSPHARVACVECHIGREFIGNQIFRKAGDLKHVVAVTFETYEYPIRSKSMRPAREICERCHSPEKFSDDSLWVESHYLTDKDNSMYNVYLILKTGGGSKRIGLGRGIHWHIENPVYYLPTSDNDQTIPYVRVVNDDGTFTEFVDVQANFDKAGVDESSLKQMDCITCHNRITHRIYTPEQSIESAIARGAISRDIPYIRQRGAKVLLAEYGTKEEALAAIARLEDYYKTEQASYYRANKDKVMAAIAEIQRLYNESVFPHQKVDWTTHPNNSGHIEAPGCFRCHDGKHLDAQDQAIRLECNLCHSIPVVADEEDFVANIEISRGPEPETHLNANWISLHNEVFDATCSNCHTTEDPGGTSNTSFCSNSACHGGKYTYAGFDAPALRDILKDQLPEQPPTPTAMPVAGTPTFDANIGPIFETRCVMCHSAASPSADLNLSSYADVMRGGQDGPVIVVGDGDNSPLVKVQREKHFANLTDAELQLVIEWILAGAPEQ